MTELAVPVKKSARISPDRWFVGVFAILLVTVIMVASYIFSYATIADAAIWSGVPEWAGWVRYLAPIFIDGAILTYTVSFAIYRWRGEQGNAKISRRWLWAFTLVSVLVNGAHAAAFWLWDLSKYEAWFGILIAISAPLAALVSAEEVVRLSFQREEELSALVQEADIFAGAFTAGEEPAVEGSTFTAEPDTVAPYIEWAEPGLTDEVVSEPTAAEVPQLPEPFQLPLLPVDHEGRFLVPEVKVPPAPEPPRLLLVGE